VSDSSIPPDTDAVDAAQAEHTGAARVLAELEEATKANQHALTMAAGEGILIDPAYLDLLYLKCAMEHLVGSWELPNLRLRFQRELAEKIPQVVEAEHKRREQEEVAAVRAALENPVAPLDHLDRGGRRRRG
jgi:hypothetical protein